jgi:hypothetical protein
LKKPFTKKGAGGVAHGVGPEFKPKYHKKKLYQEFTYHFQVKLLDLSPSIFKNSSSA